jgi:hypothetical protein
MISVRCGSCMHFEKEVFTSEGREVRGMCRRYPPEAGGSNPVWPLVYAGIDSCGEHRDLKTCAGPDKPSLAKFEHDFYAQSAERASHLSIPLTIKFDAPSYSGPLKVTRAYHLPIRKGHFGDMLEVEYIWHEASGVWAIHSATTVGGE